MIYITPKQLNCLLSFEPKAKKAEINKKDKIFLLDVIQRVKEFGLKTALSKHEQDRILKVIINITFQEEKHYDTGNNNRF